ncbi:MAG: T9SS type A sorting domain-containing protein, partial [Cytophagales bacterium]|nr:T9SS type A sorting domain-containing protein [Cytophagales bacterium]
DAYLHQHLLPERSLLQVYPNPFALRTTLRFTLPKAEPRYAVRFSLLDGRGRRVQTLRAAHYPPGFHQQDWQVPELLPGLYVVEMQVTTPRGVQTYFQKVVSQ